MPALRRRALTRNLAAFALLAQALVIGGPAPARAADDAGAHIALLKKRPAGMSDETWRERRREAARALGRLGDKRAVEPLIEIIQTERFDAVVDHAVESLGQLGDRRAVEPLRQIYNDPSRDRFARDAAAAALQKLGAEPEPGKGAPAAPPAAAAPPEREAEDRPARSSGPKTEPAKPTEEANLPAPLDLAEQERAPEGPKLGRDVLAAAERLTLAVGSFSLTYDSIQKRPQLAGSASSRYSRGIEKPGFGYSFDAGLAVAAGSQSREPPGSTTSYSSQSLVGSGQAASEMRFYPLAPGGMFGHLEGAVALAGSATRIQAVMGSDYEELSPSVTLLLGLGGGWGRVVDAGVTLRLRRIERLLRAARALGRPVNPELARRVFTAWWGLRGEMGVHRRLLVTVKLLREAGVLLGDPAPSVSYQLIRVLEDGQLDRRPEGLDVRLGVGEAFTGLEPPPSSGMPDDLGWHRAETAFARGTLARQQEDGRAEIVAGARGSYRLTGSPGFYTAQADATYRRYFYSAAWDPRGALELALSAGISDLNTDEAPGAELGPGTRLAASAGYLLFPNRASHLRAAADIALEGREVLVGISLRATWGLLDAAIAPW